MSNPGGIALYDVAVIGAGVTGAAVARELSRYELSVVVLDRGEDVACGASKANSAIVHAGYDAAPGTLMARLNVQGSAMMEGLCRELSVKYKRTGSLVIAFNAAERLELERLKAQGEKNGVPGLEILSGDEARRREPGLSGEVEAALWAPTGAITCPYELTLALMENAVVNGAVFRRGFEVTGIRREGGAFAVESGSGETVRARFLVNAAGIYADRMNELAGGRPFALRPRKGEYMLLDRAAGGVGTVVFQTPCKWGKGVLVAPTVDGNVYAGPTAMDIDDREDTSTTPEGMWYLRRLSRKSVPGLALHRVITAFAGLRAVAAGRGDFVIGAEPGVPGFVNAAGICSPGLSAAPAVALMVVEELRKTGLELREKAGFNPRRLHEKPFREMDDAERRRAVERDARYARIVCRCETVTEAEIVAALHSPVPATTMDGVKRRTRAQMGRCQGGFCGPRIIEIISRETGRPMEEITKSGGGSWLVVGKEAAR
jgi:glycerol-3-phosphate dehydrogenase